MPLYEYECEACGRRFETIQRFSDPPHETCIACGGGPVHKVLSPPAIHFKGTGWYVTDYAAKDKTRTQPGADGDAKPASGAAGDQAKSSPASDTSSSGSSDASASSAKES